MKEHEKSRVWLFGDNVNTESDVPRVHLEYGVERG